MENNERDRKLDQWLDGALSEYGAAEPRFGLEQRVLNRIRSEEQHSRKWSFWRWMPALGAIAAVIVVAVAVGPMLTWKPAVRQMSSPIDTSSRATAQATKSAGTDLLHDKVAGPRTKPNSQPALNDALRGAPTIRRELAEVPNKEIVPQSGNRDRSPGSQTARIDAQMRGTRPYEQAAPASGGEAVNLNASAGAAAPGPPPTRLLQVQPGVVGGVVGSAMANVPTTAAKTAPSNASETELKSRAQTPGVQTDAPVLLNDKSATESVTSIIANDSRRQEAHTKPETTHQDANVMQAFGVTVRFQTGPTNPAQQFPTPVPLSKQEKLAVAAGRALKDSVVAQHKSGDITPIEIKDLEIKPLQGAEKEK